jgi:hypothetical protein
MQGYMTAHLLERSRAPNTRQAKVHHKPHECDGGYDCDVLTKCDRSNDYWTSIVAHVGGRYCLRIKHIEVQYSTLNAWHALPWTAFYFTNIQLLIAFFVRTVL